VSAGILVFLPLLSWLVVQLGWREATLIAGLSAIALVPLVLLFVRDLPSDVGLLPYGAPADSTRMTFVLPPVGTVMRRAAGSAQFWLLSGSFFICGATSVGIVGTHLVPHATDHGMAEVTAASVLALLGFMNFLGTLGSGWLTDKHDPRRLLAIYFVLRGISLLILPMLVDFSTLSIFAIIFGLDFMATIPPTIELCANVFGRANVGTIYG
jgi:predicted MFS family arabinose efflux permease